MVIFNRDISRKQFLNLFILFILIIGIPLGVYLTLQQQSLKSHASTTDQTHIEIFGPSVSNAISSSRNVKIRLVYFTTPSQSSNPTPLSTLPPTVTTCKGETKTLVQLDSELKIAGYNGNFDHTQSELDAYNRSACPNGPVLSEPVKVCTGNTVSWADLDAQLKKSGFGGLEDHTQAELNAYNGATCPDQPINNTCLGNQSWNQIDSQLKDLHFGGIINHSPTELSSFNAIMCPANQSDLQKVTTCKGFAISWAQLDVELKGAQYPGPYDHSPKELSVYNGASCPSNTKNPPASSSAVLGAKIAQSSVGGSVGVSSQAVSSPPLASPPHIVVSPPSVPCLPRPACLDSTPRCEIAQPASGWCPSPSSNPGSLFPSHFRLANSQEDLINADPQVFDTNSKEVDWKLTAGSGSKTVYAQFEVNGSWSTPVTATISLNETAHTTAFQIGLNIPTAPSYGFNDLRTASSKSDVDADLKEVARMGGTIIRVFAANDKISNDEASKRLGDFLTAAQSYNISVIVSLIDFYGSGHNPQGTDSFYTGNFNGIPLLNDNFFTNGYKQDYKAFVQTMVAANKDHPNIYAWEPGNELKDDSSTQTFINFMKDMTSQIKGIDPTHSVATGMIRAAHAGLTPIQLYSNLPDVDIITIHPYNNSTDGTEDVLWAVQNGKKAIVEETGISGTGDRTNQMKQTIDYWQSQGASALLNWGFIAKGLGDNGDGDRTYGMDTIWHNTDYEKYVDLFLSTTSVAQTTGESCGQCVLGQNGQISLTFQSKGWATTATNINNMVTNWCSANPQTCSNIRTNACGSTCQINNHGNLSDKLDDTLKQLLEATNSAEFEKEHNLKFNDSVPVKIVTLNPNFKIPQGTGTQGITDQNITNASISISKLQQLSTDNSVIHVQFDGPTLTVSNGQSQSSSSSQTTTQTDNSSQVPSGGQASPTGTSQLPTSNSSSLPIQTSSPSPSGSIPPNSGSNSSLNTSSGASKYDLNNDGKVNSVDVAIFLKDWIAGTNSSQIDFNGDGTVNAVDFGLLVKNLSL